MEQIKNNIDFSNSNIDFDKPRLSISQIIGMLEKPFDRENVAQKTYNKYHDDQNSEYYGLTVQQIIEKWENKGATSRSYGSLLDDYIGTILEKSENDLTLFKLDNDFENDERLRNLCSSFDNFLYVMSQSGDMLYVAREKSIYHKVEITNPDNPSETITYYIKGRFDALFYNKRTKKWIIIDWKTSESIDKFPSRWTEKLLGPMNKFPALNYYTYTTQLYSYKKTLLEDGYLPEGTKDEDVIVMIVNLPGKNIEDTGRNWATHQAAYQYDSELLDKLYKYAIQKDYLLKKTQMTAEEKEEIINNTPQNDDNLENIF